MSKTAALVMSAVEQALFTRRRSDTRFTATGLVYHSDADQLSPADHLRAAVPSGQLPNRGSCVNPGLRQNQDDSAGLAGVPEVEG